MIFGQDRRVVAICSLCGTVVPVAGRVNLALRCYVNGARQFTISDEDGGIVHGCVRKPRGNALANPDFAEGRIGWDR